MAGQINSWQDVQGEVLNRIQNRQWKPGEQIPNEADLAEEFGCARATVNRALRAVAEQGLIDRRRKAGTRVAVHPIRKATLKIPIIRHEIEELGLRYSYRHIRSRYQTPPARIRSRMGVSDETPLLHLQAVHMADRKPYAYEDRWINGLVLDGIEHADFTTDNANEWLVRNAPFTHGDIAFSATAASLSDARNLNAEVGEALFTIERVTWNDAVAITFVQILFGPGYQMHTSI